jgi:hypothetical protein
MKPLTPRARLQIERYKAVDSIPPRDKERLLASILRAGASGVEPRFDVRTMTPVAPEPTWSQRAWSHPIGKFAVAITLLALPVLALAGVASRSARVPVSNARPAVTAVLAAPEATALRVAQEPAPNVAQEPAPNNANSLGAEEPTRPDASKPARRQVKSGVQVAPHDADEPTIDGEMRLLNEAQAATQAGDSRRALSLLDAYTVRFPAGRLSDVRTVTRLVALCQLGQVSLARREADRFRAKHPGSPFDDRVKGICASKASP